MQNAIENITRRDNSRAALKKGFAAGVALGAATGIGYKILKDPENRAKIKAGFQDAATKANGTARNAINRGREIFNEIMEEGETNPQGLKEDIADRTAGIATKAKNTASKAREEIARP